MIEGEEPPIVKYEEIPLPREKMKDEETAESSEDEMEISSPEEEDDDDEESSPTRPGPSGNQAKAEALRAETVANILDCLFIPRHIERGGRKYLQRLSRDAASRSDLTELSKTFECYLKERHIRMKGFCPVRRKLFDLLFDELIRQVSIACPERGALLLRMRDEFRMTMSAHEKLIECGVEYGNRKGLQAELETKEIRIQHEQLKAQVSRAEKRIQQLEAEIAAEEESSEQRIDMKEKRHQQRMEFLKKLNKQLKEQLSYVT